MPPPPPKPMRDPYDLERFVQAQRENYADALAELQAGRKRTHWSWYVLPQLRGLGSSAMSVRYALSGLPEARAYLTHPVLGVRLAECVAAVNRHVGTRPEAILGDVDARKFHSCVTLFARVSDPGSVFHQALKAHFGGQDDPATIALLERHAADPMRFLPPDFVVPAVVQTERFRLRSITIHDAFKDYDAVMSSRDHLWDRFGALWGWPAADLSIEQNIIDLAWHQKEFQLRSSFDYAVMATDESRLLGCVYIDPPHESGTDADVWFWARQSELPSGLEDQLGEFVVGWLASAWPFQKVTLNGQLRLIPAAER